jgi:mRNA interferase MazF
MNLNIRTVIVAPPMPTGQDYPTRVACRFKGKDRQVVLHPFRTVDRARLVRKLGRRNSKTSARVLDMLQEMFAP